MPREDRRLQLLTCARRVFARKGYHQASVDDVIHEAGVARGTFYNYFDGKRAVFQEVLEDLFHKVWDSVRPIRTGPDEDVAGQIAANLLSLCALLDGDRDIPRIVLADAMGVDPEADRAVARFYQSCRERLARALEKGQELGIVAPGDTTTLAICIMAILKEYWVQLLLGTEPPPLAAFLGELQRVFEVGWLRTGTPRRATSRGR